MTNIRSIQFLKAIAAILVVYSSSIYLTKEFFNLVDNYSLYNIGFIGQDLFFILTGFTCYLYSSENKSLEDNVLFFQKRYFRFAPLYYLISLLNIGCFSLYLWNVSKMLPMPIAMMETSFANTLLIVPTGPSFDNFRLLLPIGWILAFGSLFYLLYFFASVIAPKKKANMMLLIILILTVIGLIFRPTDLRLGFLNNPILLEFLLGMAIGNIYNSKRTIPLFISFGLVALGLVIVLVLLFYGYGDIAYSQLTLDGSKSLRRVLLWGGPSTLFAAGCIYLERNGALKRLWNSRPIQLLGNACLSIYLLHPAVFSLLNLFYRKTGLYFPPDIGVPIQVFVAVLVCVGFYKVVEHPLVRWLNKPSHEDWLKATSPKPQNT